MIAKQAIEVLRRHNEWRKGNDEDMVQSPALLTEAIDYAVKYMEKAVRWNILWNRFVKKFKGASVSEEEVFMRLKKQPEFKPPVSVKNTERGNGL